MADAKISALTALTGANTAPDDLLPIVDTSATQTKSIRRDELQTFALGTITANQPLINYSVTLNNGAVAFDTDLIAITKTAAAAASTAWKRTVGGSSIGSMLLDGTMSLGVTAVLKFDLGNFGASYTFQGSGGSMRVLNGAGNAWLPFSALSSWIASTGTFGFGSTTNPETQDGALSRAGANSIIFNGGTAGATTTSRTEINKAVTGIADNTGTATFTVTVPNAAHSASLKVRLVGSLGAGGAIGANEGTGAIEYDISITRTAGVNAVATISSAYGSATSSVAGGATCTVTAALSAISGAVGATNTFTVNVTIARGTGSSTNHTCLAYGQLLNANATGVTIA